MGAALLAALVELMAPTGRTRPFRLIRMGLEFVEEVKRHHGWVDRKLRPVVERHHRRAVARTVEGRASALGTESEMSDGPLIARVYKLNGAPADPTPGPDTTDLDDGKPEGRTAALLEALAARYSVHGAAKSDALLIGVREE